jgi:hypothetical protein
MTDTLSHKFITALDPHRDHLYSLALASVAAAPAAQGISPSALNARAEVALQSALRETFAHFEKDHLIDPAAEIEKSLAASPKIENRKSGGGKIENDFMPADIWARLVAAVQVEAARSAHSSAINPDSVLLSPDPLLAPKKSAADGDPDGLDLSPPSRFLLAGAIAILIAIILTIYLLTRPMNAPPAMRPAGSPPQKSPANTSAPATSPATAPATAPEK